MNVSSTSSLSGSSKYNNTGNYSKVCVCNQPYYGVNCGGYPKGYDVTGVIVGSTLAVGAVVGIAIGAVAAVFGAAGGGAYAYSQAAGFGLGASVAVNPLYKESGTKGENPLFRMSVV